MDTEDTPCTGEPAQSAFVYLTNEDGLFIAQVWVVDFYAEVV